jgi:hypothetical protein
LPAAQVLLAVHVLVHVPGLVGHLVVFVALCIVFFPFGVLVVEIGVWVAELVVIVVVHGHFLRFDRVLRLRDVDYGFDGYVLLGGDDDS